MARPKAKYTGGATPRLPDLEKQVFCALEKAAPWSMGDDYSAMREDLTAAAYVAAIVLASSKADISKDNLRAEQDDLAKLMDKLAKGLRDMSPDLWHLLPGNVLRLLQPTANRLDRILTALKSIDISKAPAKRKPDQARKEAALEVARRVVAALRIQQRKVKACSTSNLYQGSEAVSLAMAIGKAAGLHLGTSTWKAYIARCRST